MKTGFDINKATTDVQYIGYKPYIQIQTFKLTYIRDISAYMNEIS